MSAPHADQLCSRLAWDSSFWGFEIARLNRTRLSPNDAQSAIQWCERHKVRCLYFSADGTDADTLNVAASEGFAYIDTRVDLQISASARQNTKIDVDLGFREARADDLHTLCSIARRAHTDTRFFKDSRFPKEHAAELYVKWLERDVAEHTVLIACKPNSPSPALGYITCQSSDKDFGRIGLIGVVETARNCGVGGALVEAGLQHFRNAGKPIVRVATQATNVTAMRLYESAGFKTREVSIWFHRWFESAESSKPGNPRSHFP
jgi:dTDP-4-amino-4,6-dideoxy-D-galactose acyltransferase